MEYSNLSNLIIKVQSGDKDAMLYIIEKFSPLIKHYARSISVEDAFEELELALLNIVSRLHTEALAIDNEYTILSYLKKSIRNHSFDLQKKNKVISLYWMHTTSVNSIILLLLQMISMITIPVFFGVK